MFESMSKKKWKTVEHRTNKKETLENKSYIPKSKRPKWCREHNKKRLPKFKCFCDDKDKKCLFFAFCDADKKDYTLFGKAYDKEYKIE